jgi:hypothetical protein
MKKGMKILGFSLVLALLITSLCVGINTIVADNVLPDVTVHKLTNEDDRDSSIHVLSEADKTKILNIALADRQFQEITKGLTYHINKVSNWITEDCQTRIGGVVEVVLDAPVYISYNWPLVKFTTTDDALYQKYSEQIEMTVGILYVGVDLTAGEVIKILPFPAN